MPERIYKEDNYFNKLEILMKVLREECPWDKEQTLSSLRTYTLEETHEVLEAIDRAAHNNEWQMLRDELGDLLLQVAFYARIADEHGKFNFGDVIDGLIEKMIYRHPHVFKGARPVDLSQQWESLKDAKHAERKSLMDGIPPLPALAYAQKQQKRAARVGFDWQKPVDVIAKMEEELAELAEEVKKGIDASRIEDEFGDVLFTLVNLGRKLGMDAELALMRTNRKFAQRFRVMESLAEKKGLALSELNLDELEALYEEAKAVSASPELSQDTKQEDP
ncbi:MAG: nucleoside triphosphate pyrophosphohydrolase [Mariprofundaceae bacterium]